MLQKIVSSSPLAPKYAEAIDRESAYEKLMGEIAAGPGAPAEPAPPETTVPEDDPYAGMTPQPSSGGESLLETFLNSKTVESLGKEILRGVFGNRRRR